MMYMVPVRGKGRTAFINPDTENPKCIQQWNNQNGKSDCDSGFKRDCDKRCFSNIYKFNNKNGIDQTNHQGSRISHEYSGRMMIKYEKSNKTASHCKRKKGIRLL